MNLRWMGAANTASLGYSWTFDNTYPSSGYLGATLDTRYFTFLIHLGPYGSVWGMRYAYATGPNFGKFDIKLARPTQPDTSRTLGITDGTVQSDDDGLTYRSWVTAENAYDAAGSKTNFHNGQQVVVVNVESGNTFTGITGTDPWTGYPLLNGSPGLYRVKVATNGKDAASTGFVQRFTDITFYRLDDGGYL